MKKESDLIGKCSTSVLVYFLVTASAIGQAIPANMSALLQQKTNNNMELTNKVVAVASTTNEVTEVIGEDSSQGFDRFLIRGTLSSCEISDGMNGRLGGFHILAQYQLNNHIAVGFGAEFCDQDVGDNYDKSFGHFKSGWTIYEDGSVSTIGFGPTIAWSLSGASKKFALEFETGINYVIVDIDGGLDSEYWVSQRTWYGGVNSRKVLNSRHDYKSEGDAITGDIAVNLSMGITASIDLFFSLGYRFDISKSETVMEFISVSGEAVDRGIVSRDDYIPEISMKNSLAGRVYRAGLRCHF